MDYHSSQIARDVYNLAREILGGNVAIARVEVSEDAREPMLNFTIMVDGDPRSADPRRMISLVSAVRQRLIEQGDDRFPLLSYVDASEMNDARASA